MFEALLNTKLLVPPRRPNLVPRPRLFHRLDETVRSGCRLALVSAPPGSGKTTLVAEWIHSRSELSPSPVVTWVSLDEGDNDPARFLTYLVAALQRFEAGLGESALAAFLSPQPPPIEAVLTALLNALAALSGRPAKDSEHGFVLALDDYHVIQAQPAHHMLSFLLNHLPPQVHLLLVTRADPPLPLPLLRSRSMMIEIRAADLRFQPQEAGALLTQVMGLHLSAEDITRLEARTEGWAAGLQLAALALQLKLAREGGASIEEHEQVSTFIRAFSGDDRFVGDYLVEEVLRHQPEPVQAFLLQTSILERLCAPLCGAITGQAGTQAMLESLERSNMFVVPLDRRRQWYRYHHLFSDLLRHRLQQADPGLKPALHRRASQWFRENGLPTEAVQHALAAEDYEQAAQLIEERAWALMSQGESATYLGWLKALPADIVSSRPRLELVHAWALIATMQLDAIEPRLRDIEQLLSGAPEALREDCRARQIDSKPLQGEIAAIRATVAGMKGDVDATMRHARSALAQLPEEERLLRGILSNALGTAYEFRGDTAAAALAFAEAAQMSKAAGNTLIALIALGNLARQQEVQGRLRQAADTCLEAQHLAVQQKEPTQSAAERGPSPAVGVAYVQSGRLFCQRNDLDAALEHLDIGIGIGVKSGIVELEGAGYTALAGARLAQGDLTGAHHAVRQAELLAETYPVSVGLASQISTCRAKLWLAQGNLPAVAGWAAELGLSEHDDFRPLRQAEQAVFARLLIAERRPDAALQLLGRLLRAAQAQGRLGHAIELFALQALAHDMLRDTASAIAALEQALLLAEPQGYFRIFLDEGDPMVDLLAEAEARDVAPVYARNLIAAFCAEQREAAAGTPSRPLGAGLVEPLSTRELEVLELVADGLSNREIAQELVITVGTTKWHVNNIYSKLDVHSRTQAIARAKELGLL